MLNKISTLSLLAFLTCCIPVIVMADDLDFSSKILKPGDVRLIGWARLHGEFMIFDSHASMQGDIKYPHCVTGVMENQYKPETHAKNIPFDGKLVSVSGVLVKYADLEGDGAPLLARKVLAGSAVENFCNGINILLIKQIALVSPAVN